MAEEEDETKLTPKPVYWPGPWHFILATITDDQMWTVNRIPTRISGGDVIGFMLTDDAMHFVNTHRAEDLGVWNSLEELQAAHAEAFAAMEQERPLSEDEDSLERANEPAAPAVRSGKKSGKKR